MVVLQAVAEGGQVRLRWAGPGQHLGVLAAVGLLCMAAEPPLAGREAARISTAAGVSDPLFSAWQPLALVGKGLVAGC